MKFNMDAARAKFSQWLVVSIIQGNSKADPTAEERFNAMISAPGYDSANLELKLMINGFAFDIMDDTLTSIEKHIDEEVEERSQKFELAIKKMEALKVLMNMKDVSDLEEFINGN